MQAGDAPTAAPGPGQTPLAELLDTEGRLDLASGFRGSIDARGWRLVSGPQEVPAFAPLAAEEGRHWSGIFQPPGIDYVARALAVDGAGNLYVGGEFTSAGGVAANNIAKWDGSAWSALGSGLGGSLTGVWALVVDGAGNLYAGGTFGYVAKWDGNAWSPLAAVPSGEPGYVSVSALAVDGAGNLYAGGRFTTAGGVAANNIAKWDGSTWSALGSGLGGVENPVVSALAVDGAGNLYAGGG